MDLKRLDAIMSHAAQSTLTFSGCLLLLEFCMSCVRSRADFLEGLGAVHFSHPTVSHRFSVRTFNDRRRDLIALGYLEAMPRRGYYALTPTWREPIDG